MTIHNTCPKCNRVAHLTDKQYLYMYDILECSNCQVRWRSRRNSKLKYDDHYGVFSVMKADDKRIEEDTNRLLRRLNV